MKRRDLAAFLALPFSGASAPARHGLSLNEDPNHFYHSRRQQRLTRQGIASWVEQYQNTQVREVILCVNAMRAAFASKTRESFWSGFDAQAGPSQPLFASIPDTNLRQTFHDWVRCAWQMSQDGLDLYAIWIPEIRRRGLSPWVSIRMNDLHDVENEKHPLHSMFWRENPHLRRVSYRGEQRDKALDYARPEVRAHNFRFLEEVCERYDFDCLELDWMRHGFHFRPGFEAAGQTVLNDFHAETRKLLDAWSKKRRHPIRLAVRVPSTHTTAQRLALDPLPWPVDFVTPTNFWRTVDTNMPMSQWRALLPKKVQLAAGIELGLNAFGGSVAAGGRAWQSNSLTTLRGAAAAYLAQGVDRIYLFNYMDSVTTLDDQRGYEPLLRECGELETLAGKTRRHVVTYQDTWAPGETPWGALPADLLPERWRAFRLPSGPSDPKLRPTIWLGIRSGETGLSVRLNGAPCEEGTRQWTRRPGPECPCFSFVPPANAWQGGDAVIEVTASQGPRRLEWVELELQA